MPKVNPDAAMDTQSRHTLARDVFDAVFIAFETFNDNHVGADLAYLLGAILNGCGDNVDWRHDEMGGRIPAIIPVLKESFPPDSPLWQFIVLDEEKTEASTTPPDPEGLNDKRAEWARAALEEFAEQTGLNPSEDADGWFTIVSDLLSDLRHFCDRCDVDWAKVNANADTHYAAETSEDGEEE